MPNPKAILEAVRKGDTSFHDFAVAGKYATKQEAENIGLLRSAILKEKNKRALPAFDKFVDNEHVGTNLATTDFSALAKMKYMEDGMLDSPTASGATGFLRVDEVLDMAGVVYDPSADNVLEALHTQLAKDGFEEPIRVIGEIKEGRFVAQSFENVDAALLLARQQQTSAKIPVIFHIGSKKHKVKDGKLALPEFYTSGAPDLIEGVNGGYTKFPRTSQMSRLADNRNRKPALIWKNIDSPEYLTKQARTPEEVSSLVQNLYNPRVAYVVDRRKAPLIDGGSVQDNWIASVNKKAVDPEKVPDSIILAVRKDEEKVRARVAALPAKKRKEIDGLDTIYKTPEGKPRMMFRTEKHVRVDEAYVEGAAARFRTYLAGNAKETGANAGTFGQSGLFSWVRSNQVKAAIDETKVGSDMLFDFLHETAGVTKKDFNERIFKVLQGSIDELMELPQNERGAALLDVDIFKKRLRSEFRIQRGDPVHDLAVSVANMVNPQEFMFVFLGKKPLHLQDQGRFAYQDIAKQLLDLPDFERWYDDIYDLSKESFSLEEGNKRIRSIIEEADFDHILYVNVAEDNTLRPQPSILWWREEQVHMVDYKDVVAGQRRLVEGSEKFVAGLFGAPMADSLKTTRPEPKKEASKVEKAPEPQTMERNQHYQRDDGSFFFLAQDGSIEELGR